MKLRTLSLLSLFMVVACGSEPVRDPGYAAALPLPSDYPSAQNRGAIYQPNNALLLYENVRARKVGDLLTVRLAESTNATKTAATKTKKDTDVSIVSPTLIGRPFGKLNTSITSAQEFEGEGSSNQSNSLLGSITVTVADVLANGYLVVRGEKILSLNQGEERIRVSGIVRPADIQPDNSVLSTQLADATIAYGGRGVTDDANRMGWLARVFNSGFWPF